MARTDWTTIRLDYVSDRTATQAYLAAKYGVPERTLRYHAEKERWQEERQLHSLKIADNLAVATADAAMLTVRQLNERWLKRSEQMHRLLEHKLYVRTPEGKAVPRDSLTVTQIAKAATAFGDLFKLDRLATGADLEHPAEFCVGCSRYSRMSDAELEAEWAKVMEREREQENAKKPTLQ